MGFPGTPVRITPEADMPASAEPAPPLTRPLAAVSLALLLLLAFFYVFGAASDLGALADGKLPADHRGTFASLAGGSFGHVKLITPGITSYISVVESGYALHELTFALLFIVIVAFPFRRRQRWAWWAAWLPVIANLGYTFTFGVHDHAILARSLLTDIALPVLLLAHIPAFFHHSRGPADSITGTPIGLSARPLHRANMVRGCLPDPPAARCGEPASWQLAPRRRRDLRGVLFRAAGAHSGWGVATGLGLQVPGLAIAIVSLLALGRSFGFVAADRGLVTRDPYAVVRHPVYAAYIVIQSGYLLQAISPRNIAVLVLATGCNAGRIIAEERVLAASSAYGACRRRVRWGLRPGLW
jgi:Isoprenylcysteine carboxyl methyltransferase (ICMT) family